MSLLDRLFGRKHGGDRGQPGLSYTAGSPDLADSPEHSFEENSVASALRRIQAALEASDLDTADSLAHAQAARTPDDPELLTSRSWIALERHDYEAAISHAQRVLESNARHTMALNNRGYAHMCIGRFDSAIADFNRALGIDAGLALARFNLANALAYTGQFGKAVYEATRLTERGDFRADGHVALQQIHWMYGDISLAVVAANRAVELAPRSVDAALNAVEILAFAQLEQAASRALSHFDSLDPRQSLRCLLAALLARLRGDFEAAERHLGDVQPGSLEYSRALHVRAWLAADKGDCARALELLDEGIALSSSRWSSLHFRCALLLELRRDDEVAQLLDLLLEKCPRFCAAASGRAVLAGMTGDFSLAQKWCDVLLSTDGGRIRYRFLAYTIAFHAGRLDDALAALEADGESPAPIADSLNRAVVFARRTEWPAARVELDRALNAGIRAVIPAGDKSMSEQWEYLAGCHAHLAILPEADSHAHFSKAMEFFQLARQAGRFDVRHAWYQPRFHPLRGIEAFRRICGE